MPGEGGFELASMYVTISPDAADFDEKAREQIGDITVTVPVAADATEADATIDDLRAKLESLEASANSIQIAADGEPADATIDDLMAKLEALEAEHAQISLNLDDEGATAKLAELNAQAEELQAQFAALDTTGAASDIDGLAAKLEHLHEVASTITIIANDGPADATIGGLMVKLEALQAEHADLVVNLSDEGATAKLAALSAQADELEAQLASLGTGEGVLAGRTADLADIAGQAQARLNTFDAAAEDTGATVRATAEDVQAFADEFQTANFELREFEVQAGVGGAAVESLAGGFQSLGQRLDVFMTSTSGTQEELAGLQSELAGLTTELDELEAQLGAGAGAFGEFAMSAAAATPEVAALNAAIDEGRLNATAGMYDDVAMGLEEVGADAETAGTAASGASRHFGGLHGMLMGLPPAFIDVTASVLAFAGALVAIGYVSDVMLHTGVAVSGLTEQLQQQDKATGTNLSGWQKYAEALNTVAAGEERISKSSQDPNALKFKEIASDTGVAAAQAAAHVEALANEVHTLSANLGVGTGAAEHIASDLDIIGSAATSDKDKVAAFDDEVNRLTGNLIGRWQGQLAITQALDTLAAAAKQTGASMEGTNAQSVQMQEDFTSGATALDSYAEKQSVAGKMTQQMASYLADQTAKLAAWTGGNQQAIAVTERMIDQDRQWGASTSSVNRAIDALAASIDGHFIAGLVAAGHDSQTVNTDVDNLTAAIHRYGAGSGEAADAAHALVGALEAAGVSADKAKAEVAALEAQLAALHSKSITVTINTDENTHITQELQHVGQMAKGGRIPGYGGGDIVPALLEPGETVVPKHLTPVLADTFRAHGIPGFASGGMISASGVYGFPQDVFNIDVGLTDNLAISDSWPDPGKPGAGNGRMTRKDWRLLPGEANKGDSAKDMADDARTLTKAFRDAYHDTAAQIKQETATALADIKRYYSGPAATQLEKTISAQSKALEALANKSQAVATEIANMKQAEQAEIQSLQSYSSISNIQGTTNSKTGVTAPPTGKQIESGLQADLAQLRKFFAVIGELKKMKLAAAMIEQVIQLGPADGVTYGEAIIAGGKNLIAEINKTEKAISGEETLIGQRTADIQYGQNISKGFLSGLDKEKAELDKRMKDLGDTIAKELDKALEKLKIHVTVTKGHAAGGLITGGISGRDSVPAMLMPGEAVVPTHLVPSVAPFLGRHGVPGFADGGYIGGGSPGTDRPILIQFLGTTYPTNETVAALSTRLASAVGAAG